MILGKETGLALKDHFNALILDNEVTVGEFVVDPPLPWTRLIQKDQVFQVPAGYPTPLTKAQAKVEMRNWDDVSLSAIVRAVPDLARSLNYVIFGNNAGQGFPLAQSLPGDLIADYAAIIYANTLPQISAYRQIGYRRFFPRSQAVNHLLSLAKKQGRPLALYFINTIQHNELNYHDP